MLTFAKLPVALRGGYLTLIFILLCLSVCLLPLVLRKRVIWAKGLLPVCTLVSGVLIVLYATNMKASKYNMPQSAGSTLFWELPLWITVVPVVLMAVYLIYVTKKELEYRSVALTRASIKESLDQITTGLCFSQENGRIILANHTMQSLCYAIVGRDLQDAELFWKLLSGEAVRQDVQRLSAGAHPQFRLPDGKVWTFSRQLMEGVVQLTAADTTELQALTDEWKEKNIQLASMNLRLKHYGENLETLTRSRERLEFKAKLHNDLGQALVATRRYLQEPEGEIALPMGLWRHNVAMLRAQTDNGDQEDPMDMMRRAAAAAGVTVELQGSRPRQMQIDRLFFQASLEALTNAVRHAEATVLHICITEDEETCTIRLSNNGRVPQSDGIVEGGGLSSLRRKVEYQGGTMVIRCDPEFALIITVPKDWSEIV